MNIRIRSLLLVGIPFILEHRRLSHQCHLTRVLLSLEWLEHRQREVYVLGRHLMHPRLPALISCKLLPRRYLRPHNITATHLHHLHGPCILCPTRTSYLLLLLSSSSPHIPGRHFRYIVFPTSVSFAPNHRKHVSLDLYCIHHFYHACLLGCNIGTASNILSTSTYRSYVLLAVGWRLMGDGLYKPSQ